MFCSKKCYDRYQARRRATFTCEVCGVTKYLSPSQVRHRHGGRFCSNKCEGDARIARPLQRQHNGRCARLDQQVRVIYEPTHQPAVWRMVK